MICANNLKRCYYLIQTGVMINYKEQIFIIRIKANIYCFVNYFSLQI